MRIILGSQSENRREVLRRAGYVFDVMVSGIDEKAVRHDDFYELPLLLAQAKADALLPKIKEPALLITADQVVVWGGELREKAASPEEARHFLETYSGSENPAECINGIGIWNTASGKSILVRETSKVFFSKIPPNVIEAFLQTDLPFRRAGGFDIRYPLLAPYMRFEGTLDSVLGLPMHTVEAGIKKLLRYNRHTVVKGETAERGGPCQMPAVLSLNSNPKRDSD